MTEKIEEIIELLKQKYPHIKLVYDKEYNQICTSDNGILRCAHAEDWLKSMVVVMVTYADAVTYSDNKFVKYGLALQRIFDGGNYTTEEQSLLVVNPFVDQTNTKTISIPKTESCALDVPLFELSESAYTKEGMWKCNVFVYEAMFCVLLKEYVESQTDGSMEYVEKEDYLYVHKAMKNKKLISGYNRYQNVGTSLNALKRLGLSAVSFDNVTVTDETAYIVFFYSKESDENPIHMEIVSKKITKDIFEGIGAHQYAAFTRKYTKNNRNDNEWNYKEDNTIYCWKKAEFYPISNAFIYEILGIE